MNDEIDDGYLYPDGLGFSPDDEDISYWNDDSDDEEILFYSVGSLQMVSNMEWTSTFGEVIKDSYLPLLPEQVLIYLMTGTLNLADMALRVDSYVMETHMEGGDPI